MAIEQKGKLKSILIHWVLVPVFGGLLISYFTCNNCFVSGNYKSYFANAVMCAVFWLVLSHGNSFFSDQVNKYVTWIEAPLKRFLIGIVVLLIYTSISSFVVLYFFIGYVYELDFYQIIITNWQDSLKIPLSITIFIAITLHGREFLMSWRQTAINLEKVKSENIASQYESLKNQVNPHFLFNSLNALSSLVYSDQDKAVDFIRKLSEVYRYVLDHQMDEVVTLKEEMEFVESFIFLNKIRFGENLKVQIGEFSDLYNQMIPPLAVQMLLENCFKHNVVSKANQLQIEIISEGEFIVVKNNLNPKKVAEHSSGLGLNNIKSRFSYLTKMPVEIIGNKDSFTVKIPLLKEI